MGLFVGHEQAGKSRESRPGWPGPRISQKRFYFSVRYRIFAGSFWAFLHRLPISDIAGLRRDYQYFAHQVIRWLRVSLRRSQTKQSGCKKFQPGSKSQTGVNNYFIRSGLCRVESVSPAGVYRLRHYDYQLLAGDVPRRYARTKITKRYHFSAND